MRYELRGMPGKILACGGGVMRMKRMMRIVEDIIFILILICVPHLFLDKFGIYDSAFRIIQERGLIE